MRRTRSPRRSPHPCSGVLVKVCRKKPKPRQFFLCNDVLVYGNILISKRKYNKQHVVPLEEVSIEDIPDEAGRHALFLTHPFDESSFTDGLTNGFLVKTRTKSFAVHAGTASEKREWITHIQRCINVRTCAHVTQRSRVQDLLKNTGKTPAKEHAAVWVPDVETKLCMACKKTQFTLIIRKVSDGCTRACPTCHTAPLSCVRQGRMQCVQHQSCHHTDTARDKTGARVYWLLRFDYVVTKSTR